MRRLTANPTLSVVMSHFNHGALVGVAIDALLAQELPPSEIIVVDDGSRAEDRAALAEAAGRSPIVRVDYLPQNIGVVGAFMRGVNQASGEFVYLASADDRARPSLFASLLPPLQARPDLGLASGRVGLIDSEGDSCGVVPTPLPRATAGGLAPEAVRARLDLHGSWFVGNATVYRTEALADAGGLSAQCGPYADGAVAMVIAASRGAYFTPEVHADWRRLSSGYSATTHADLSRASDAIFGAQSLLDSHSTVFAPGFVSRWVADELRRLLAQHLRDTIRRSQSAGRTARVLDTATETMIMGMSAMLVLRLWGPRGAYHLARPRFFGHE